MGFHPSNILLSVQEKTEESQSNKENNQWSTDAIHKDFY